VLRSAQGSAQLAQTTRREANVRGFNDVFTLSGWLAIGFLCWLLLLSLRTAVLKQWRKRHPHFPPRPRRPRPAESSHASRPAPTRRHRQRDPTAADRRGARPRR
jgi:hypothetical protein